LDFNLILINVIINLDNLFFLLFPFFFYLPQGLLVACLTLVVDASVGIQCASVIAGCASQCTSFSTQCLNCVGSAASTCCPCLQAAFPNFPC
jgi:hypothetical protein